MIYHQNHIFYDQEEMNRISENLPSEIVVSALMKMENYETTSDIGFLLIPYEEKPKVRTSNMLFLEDEKTEWMEMNPKDAIARSEKGIMLNTKQIPDEYNFIDFYLQNFYLGKEREIFMENCSITFKTGREKLFEYNYYPANHFKSVFIGTFARVTDGWKFYPKLESYNISFLKLTQNYQ